MKYTFPFLFLMLLCGILTAQNPTLPTGFVQTVVADSLNPTAMAFDLQGNLYLSQKDGRVLLVNKEGDLLPDPVLTLSVDNFNERGLSGIALHPDFDNHPWMYLYYTVADSNYNRISRFRINGNLAVPGSEQIIFNFDALSSGIHNGGAMVFGNDGKLYVGSGDGGKSSNSQSLSVTLGKVLRLNEDGSIPSDNPFYAELMGKNRAIYAYGLRNPFSMAIQKSSGRIFVSDVGQGLFEEVNEILPLKNYGWSLIEGPANVPDLPENYQDPFFSYPHATGCAIVGAAVYEPATPAFPATFAGKFFYADYCTGVVRLLDLVTGQSIDTFATGLKQPVAFAVNSQDGSLWYLMRSGIGGGSIDDNTSSNNGTLWKVFYTGSGAPFISVPPQNTLLSVGENAQFEVQVLGNQPIHFQWQKNGVDLPGTDANTLDVPAVSLLDNGAQFRCIATNTVGSDTSATAVLSVTANKRPLPVILLPATGFSYQAGDIIHFQGEAIDPEEGAVPATHLRWRIDFHHDTHVHPALAPVQDIFEGYYAIASAGETSTNTWFRIHLTATDNQGLEQTVWRDIFPQLTTVRVEGPVGLPVNVDGIVRPMPYTFQSVRQQQHIALALDKIFAPDTLYLFDKWAESDENGPLYTFFAPDSSGLVLHARYQAYPLGDGTGLHGEYFVDPEFDLDEDPVVLRLDTVINFNWGNTSPFPNQLPANGYTVRWSGFVQPYFSEAYSFHVRSDDGSRLWIGDSLIVDKWVAQATTEHTGTIQLTGGEKIPIRLEYLEIGGGADVSLSWSSEHTPKAIVPKRQLYPIPPYEPATLRGTVWHDTDYDEILDSTEPLLKNTTVLLFDGQDSTLMATQLCDNQGRYKFSDLVAGSYFMRFLPAPDAIELEPRTHVNQAGQTEMISLGTLESLAWNVSFVTRPASISGVCFQDNNYNGLLDAGERLLSDISILLFNAADSSLIDVRFSDTNGKYLFNYLTPGQYFAHFSNALAAQDLVPGAGLSEQGNSPVLAVEARESVQFAAAFVLQPGRVAGRVWLDENRNGFPDLEEPLLAGATILLHTADSSFVEAQTTANDGSFLFEQVAPGGYFVMALTNALPLALSPSFGLNNDGQSPLFEMFVGEDKFMELGFMPKNQGSDKSPLDVQLFPNPARNAFFVQQQQAGASSPIEFWMTDVTGRILGVEATFEMPANRYRIDVKDIRPGVYFLHMKQASNREVQRVIRL